MTRHSKPMRLAALALAILTTAGAAVPVCAAPIGDGVTPSYDEAYYATLDYYGNLIEGSVVKSYTLNGASSFTDYGTYDQVVNLTDGTAPNLEEGSAAFQFAQSPDHFYFEGKTARPFQDLPWTVTLRYTLNGVPVKAEDLAGERGVVEILLDIVPNPNAGDYARYNYTLEAMALFNQDDILSLEAPGAQVQLVGNLRSVLFMALPGEEQHFTIRVGSDNFSFSGMTILMVPATLAQLEQIAKLSQRKNDLEEDYRALSGSLDTLLDALNDIQGGLYASADGLDRLDTARGTISGGKGLIYDEAGVLRGDLTNIASLLEPVEQRTQALSQTVTGTKTILNEMTDTALALQGQLKALEESLSALERGTGSVKDLLERAADLEDSLKRLERALDGTGVSGGGSSSSMTATVDQVKKVHGVYDSAGETATFITGMLVLSGQSPSEAAASVPGVIALQAIPDLETFRAAQAAGAVGAATEADWKRAQELKQLQAGVQGGMSFQRFCSSLPGVSSSTAKQMNDLWIIYSSGQGTDGTALEGDPVSAEPEVSSAQPAGGAPAGVMSGALASSMLIATASESLPVSEQPPAPAEQASPAPEQLPEGEGDTAPQEEPRAPQKDAGKPGENDSVGSAAVDLIAGGLDSANNKINQIQRDLNDTLERIARPTAQVVGELADLCRQIDELVDLVDDAADLSAALRQSSQEVRTILDSAHQLRSLLNDYEPTLQQSLTNVGAMSTAAATTVRDLERLLSDTEALMKSSGSQLDSGTKETLRGLSDALRQTAKAMAATNDVRAAKAAITDIVEDTWHEYTGDVNNILLMDAGAQPVSLTDHRNPAPSSVQVLIRTQEIKTEEPTAEQLAAAAPERTTFWGRVAQMFRDFWNAVTGIFR